MRICHTLLPLLTGILIFHQPLAAAGIEPFVVREGLPNAAAKLRKGGDFQIVFIGGSITKAGNGGGFSASIPAWLAKEFPASKIQSVNAGINGTDSAFGAVRVDRDVLSSKPDLVFVEFVVNDGTASRVKDMEIIVRKIWTQDPETDIVFLYTISKDHLPDWQRGELPRSAKAHEKVADFYGIPSIALGTGIVQAMQSGKQWEDLMRDGAHPNADGYDLYTEQITKALGAAFNTGESGRSLSDETLIPDLVLYPAPKEVLLLPAPEPVLTDEGQPTKMTFALPDAGKFWRDEAEYAIDGKTLWALYVQPWKKGDLRIGGKLKPTFSLNREAWQPMRWLEGAEHFDGPEGMALWKGSTLSARENDLPVISFIAPETGSYIFELDTSGIRLWSHHKQLALNVIYFPWGATEGKSIAFFNTDATEKKALKLRFTQKLVAGEQVAVALDTDVFYGGGGALLKDLSIRVGFSKP